MRESKKIISFISISTEDIHEDLVQDSSFNHIGQTDIENISASIDEADTTLMVLESICKHLESSPGLDQRNAKIINTAVEHLLKQIDYNKTSLPSLESYGQSTSKLEGTQLALESIKSTMKEIWLAIKKAFRTMFDWIVDFFKKILNIGQSVFNGVIESLDNLNQYITDVKKLSQVSAESNDQNTFDINKPFAIPANQFGQYLGNNKKDIDTYVSDLTSIDNCILEAIKHSVDDLNVNLPSASSNFKHPFTIEQKEFFKDKIPYTTSEAKVVPLQFKKGFIWKIEGASLHGNKDNLQTFQINAGVHRTKYSFDIEEVDCLTVEEIKNYLSKIKYDLEDNGKNTHVLASKILKNISLKIKEIDILENDSRNLNPEEFENNKKKFTVAKHSLNALKNIEIGYWQYKNETTLKIKEYCDASIRTRVKDLQDFNTV